MTPSQALRQRLAALESHLTAENPDQLPVLRAYRDFDRLLRGMGLLARNESLATRTPWWPVVTVLGPAAPGKSAFIDGFRQSGGERPADDRVTILCYGGTASGADPRIPFACGESFRPQASDSARLRGRVLVDASDAAAPPVEAVVELSDLVLVFPGAGQPEPDALKRLIAKASHRADARKVLTVRSDADLAGIDARLEAAGAERGRRVAGLLDTLAEELEDELVPYVEASLARWRRGVRTGALVWLALLASVLGGAVVLGGPENLPAFAGWLLEARPALTGGLPLRPLALLAGVGGLWLAGGHWVRRAVARRIAADLPTRMGEADLDPRRAFLKSTGAFRVGVAGWGRRARRRLSAIREAMATHARRLGERGAPPSAAVAEAGSGAGFGAGSGAGSGADG